MKFELFTDDELDQLEGAVLTVLEKRGVLIQDEEILDSLAKFGASVDSSISTARFPPELIKGIAGEQLPERERRFAEGEYRVGIGLQVAHFYYDFERKERLPGNRELLIELIKFGEVFSPELTVSHALTMREVPPLIEPLEAMLLLYEWSSRPGSVYPYYAEQLPYLEELGEILFDDSRRLLGGGIFIVTPLRMDARASGILKAKARMNLPCYIGTQPVAGGTAPASIAGTIVLGASEVLSAFIAQRALGYEGEVRASICSGILDMRTANTSFSTPETMLIDLGFVEFLRKRFGLPASVAGRADYTSAKFPGLQATYEKMMESLVITAFTGESPRLGSGMLDSGKTFSPEQLLLDQEMGRGLWEVARKPIVSPETIALEDILEIGDGIATSFIQTEHTLRHFKDFWYPKYFDRGVWRGDEHLYEAELLHRLNREYKELKASYRKPEVDTQRLDRASQLVRRAQRELLS